MVLRECGPYDEPGFCYSQGMQFFQGNLFRQAGQQFDRAISLYPGHAGAGLELAGMYVVGNKPDEALQIIEQLKKSSDPTVRETNKLGLSIAEASAYLTRQEPEKANTIFTELNAANPSDTKVLDSAVSVFLRHKLFPRALQWIDRRLKINPDDPNTLVNKGYVHIQAGQFKEAIPPLTRAISVVTNDAELLDSALFNRAIANLQAGNVDAAAADYRELLPRYESAPQIHYGLAQIAFQQMDTNAAILNAERYLQLAPTNTDEARDLQRRLAELKAGGR
jgi:tetratricopeptide (TPR) repeat protein